MIGEKTWRPGQGEPIAELFAWVATEPDGGEGVCGAAVPGIAGMVPLVGADRDRIESYRPFAVELRRRTGYPIRLARFVGRVTLEELP